MTIREANAGDIHLLVKVADEVWEKTYRHIVTPLQIQVMMHDMHTPEAYSRQMQDGDRFFMAMEGAEILGFISFHPRITADESIMRIPKLYIRFSAQGTGSGKALLQQVEEEAARQGLQYLELNVNRYNKALYFYRKNGFFIHRSEDLDYKGFPLNDYVMRRKVMFE